jgi:hypothetical protein
MLDSGDCSIMLRKFEECAKQEKLYEESISTEPFPPQLCFFYGTLMDSDELAKVLELEDTERPVTRPASIAGYSCKMCGIYPSLVDGPSPESIVHGVAFEVTSRLMQGDSLPPNVVCATLLCHPIRRWGNFARDDIQVEKQC